MSENSKFNLDVIRLVKEVSKQQIENFELEYGDIKIKMSASKSSIQPNIVSNELPNASNDDLEQMEAQESKAVVDRIKEKDESLLEDLDYLDPELAGELRRANVIKVNDAGQYEYIDEEEYLDA